MGSGTAPFYSGTDLTQMPGNAALGMGGTGLNYYDPSQANPLTGLQHAIEVQGQEQHEDQKLKNQQQYDRMSKLLDYEHQDKVLKYHQDIQDRDSLMKMLSEKNLTGHTLKDENGQDMSIAYSPDDQEVLDKLTDDTRETLMKNPTATLSNPTELGKAQRKLSRLHGLATARAAELMKMRVLLSQTYDPAEKERIANSMQEIQSTPLNDLKLPEPHLSAPQLKPFINQDKYKDGKGFQEFDNGTGIPNNDFYNILHSTDNENLNKAYGWQQSYMKNGDPQDFQALIKDVNEITDSRGMERLNLGTISPDGKVTFNKDPRPLATALELERNGRLQAPSEEDQLKTEKTRVEIDKAKADIDKLKHPERYEKLTGAQQEEIRNKERHYNTAKTAINTFFDDRRYKQDGTPLVEPNGAAKPFTDVGDIKIGDQIKKLGLNPKDWTAFSVYDDIKPLTGVEKKTTYYDKDGNLKKVEGEGETEDVELPVMLKNTKTGDLMAVTFRKTEAPEKGKDGKPVTNVEIVSHFDKRKAFENYANHLAKYKESGDQVAYNLTKFDEEKSGKGSAGQSKTASNQDDPVVIKARLVPIKGIVNGVEVTRMKDPLTGKIYKQ